MKYGIIFDLDGTLWEVIESTYKSVNEVARKYKLAGISKDTICACFGLNKEETAKRYFPNLNQEYRLKLLDEIALINIKNLRSNGGNLYNGVELGLKQLHNTYNLYIVSNTGNIEYIDAFLDAHNVRKYFSDYIAAGSINLSKCEAIKMIIQKNKIDKAIYVGDTTIDLESSNLSGIPFVWAKYGFGTNIDAYYTINSFSEISDVVKKMLNH